MILRFIINMQLEIRYNRIVRIFVMFVQGITRMKIVMLIILLDVLSQYDKFSSIWAYGIFWLLS